MNDGKMSNWLSITANLGILMLATAVEAQEVLEDRGAPVEAVQIEGVDTGSLDRY